MSSGEPAATMRPPSDARARPHVDDVVGRPDRVLVVLDHQHAVAEVAQPRQRRQQARVVALVQADRRFVQDVEHADQRAADLRRQPDALRLAARQRRRGAVQRQVVDADVVEERQPVARLAQDAPGDLLLARRQLQVVQEVVGLADRQRGRLGDALAADLDEARLLAQPRAVALLAHRLGHVAVELVVDRLEVLVGGAPLLAPPPLVLLEAPPQVRDHALELALVGVRPPVLLERELDLVARRPLRAAASATWRAASPTARTDRSRSARRPRRGSGGRRRCCAAPTARSRLP